MVVRITYTIAPEREDAFPRRDGPRAALTPAHRGDAMGACSATGRVPHEFVELFVVPSWDEHLRQHTDRLTGTDEAYLDSARSLSDPAPRTSHLIATEPPD